VQDLREQVDRRRRLLHKKERLESETPATRLRCGAFVLRYAHVSVRGMYPETPHKANQDCYCVRPRFWEGRGGAGGGGGGGGEGGEGGGGARGGGGGAAGGEGEGGSGRSCQDDPVHQGKPAGGKPAGGAAAGGAAAGGAAGGGGLEQGGAEAAGPGSGSSSAGKSKSPPRIDALFGVFDGHGSCGHLCSRFARDAVLAHLRAR
jgi:hypothetical protein